MINGCHTKILLNSSLSHVFPILPIELENLIFAHFYAMKIQRCWNIFQMRHVYNKLWKQIRMLLLQYLSIENFDLLQKSSGVRKEWRKEAESWKYTLQRKKYIELNNIILEVSEGLWSVK